MHSVLLLVIVIVAAVGFDFTNGFHDTANVVASVISTRSMSPARAIALASVLNFAGAFISLQVAATIATGIVQTAQVSEQVAFAALLAGLTWNLVTWRFGLPSSSSHALVGGVAGAVLLATGGGGIRLQALIAKVIVPAVVAPVLAFLVAATSIVVIYRLVGRRRPGTVRRGFRLGQMASSGLLALAHGTNDAQKTMGVMGLALVAHGSIPAQHFHVPAWVVLLAASAMALGTYAGGWRIIRTLGTRIIDMDEAQGFAAQSAGAAVILVSSHYGYPLSSTHVISGGIVGAGAAKRFSAVRWGIAGNIVQAWLLTLPACAGLGIAFYWVVSRFGHGAAGPVLVGALALVMAALLFTSRRSQLRALAQPL